MEFKQFGITNRAKETEMRMICFIQGKMFCLDVLTGEEGPTLCCGNSKGELFVWDIT